MPVKKARTRAGWPRSSECYSPCGGEQSYSDNSSTCASPPPVPIAAAAIWSEGDPLVDIDGALRPAIEGSPDFAGADRLP